jgi:hypothetical protein
LGHHDIPGHVDFQNKKNWQNAVRSSFWFGGL